MTSNYIVDTAMGPKDREFQGLGGQHSVFSVPSPTAQHGLSACVGRMGSSKEPAVRGGCHG